MTDQYKEQYQKETEQIHAPADLIARTKAAMREEEMRMQRKRSRQMAELTGWEVKPVAQGPGFAEKKRDWNRMARRWAYPLTAVAVIFILASVSLMMRGLKNLESDRAPLYDAATTADSDGAEFATQEAMEEAVCEEAPMLEGSAAAASGTGAESGAVTGRGAKSAAAEAMEKAEAADMGEPADAASEKEMAESADEAKEAAEAPVADYAAEVNVTVKRVWKKPDFVAREDVELQTYEDKVFWVVRETEGWAAYVESESRGGYEIRGEAEDMESFLAAGYRRLSEISF